MCISRLENLKTCYDLITKHGIALQRALSELETGDDLASKNKIVNERATLFRISSNAMINVSIKILIQHTKKFPFSKKKIIIHHIHSQYLYRHVQITYKPHKRKGIDGQKCCNMNATKDYIWKKWSNNLPGNTHI